MESVIASFELQFYAVQKLRSNRFSRCCNINGSFHLNTECFHTNLESFMSNNSKRSNFYTFIVETTIPLVCQVLIFSPNTEGDRVPGDLLDFWNWGAYVK